MYQKQAGNKTVLIYTGLVDAHRPSESKADAKHQGLAMALAKLQRKPFGEDRLHVAEVHGDVRNTKFTVN